MKKFICTILAVLTVCMLLVITGCNNNYSTYLEAKENYRPNSNNGSSDEGLSDSLIIWLYCKVSDVKITHNSSYTICTGKVTNTSSDYRFRYVKVQGEFKNYSGRVVDTDWTFVVASEWLNPGASKSFKLSVPKDASISTCSVTVYA